MADPTTVTINGQTVALADMDYALSFDPDKKSFGLWSKVRNGGGDWKKQQTISATDLGEVTKKGMAAKKEVVVQLPVTKPILNAAARGISLKIR